MSSLATRLARPEILALPPFDISANANDACGADAIKLDANENPFPPLGDGSLAANVNRYPEPQPERLRQAMAALYGAPRDARVITRGADDAIDMLVRGFCRPEVDAVAISSPAFAAYAHFARLQGARVIDIPLTPEFEFDPEAFIERLKDDDALKLAFICTPNNPTGVEVDPDAVLAVADALPETIVVADEAYLEFSATPSLCAEAASRCNLVVLKTLSKAFGLAGARVGCAIGSPELIAMAARALPPYPMPTPSIEAAMAALSPSRRSVHAERVARIKAERARVAAGLSASSIVRRVRDGGGIFLFLEFVQP